MGSIEKRLRELAVTVDLANAAKKYDVLAETLTEMIALEQEEEGVVICKRVRCKAYFELEKYAECIQDCSDVLKHRPDDRLTLTHRMRAYRYSNNKEKALADNDALLALVSSDDGKKALLEYRERIEDKCS